MHSLLLPVLISLAMLCLSHAYYFNDYVYAQQWPASLCLSGARNAKQSCQFAKNITTWTNHGLWPSVNETYPAYCNSSWELLESDIKTLEDQMRSRWPSFAGDDFSFWQHEWSKHGTCAASVAVLNGPYNYFKFALFLNQKFDLLQSLSTTAQKIVPDDSRCYKYADFASATRQLFNESVILGCVWNPDTKRQYVAQIEICFGKAFTLNCDPNAMAERSFSSQGYFGADLGDMPRVTPCYSNQDICYATIPH